MNNGFLRKITAFILAGMMMVVLLPPLGAGAETVAETEPLIGGYTDLGVRKNIDRNKEWNIQLNSALDPKSVTADSVYVLNQSGQKVNSSVAPGSNQKTISVSPPEGGYTYEASYTLIVTERVQSIKGELLKNPLKMTFIIDRPEISRADVQLKEDIVVVNQTTSEEIQESITGVTETEEANVKITYSDPPEEVKNLQSEDVFMMAPTKDFPLGYIAEVKSIQQNNDQTIIEYEQPDTEKVFSDLDIDVNKTLEKSPIVDVTVEEGVEVLKEWPSDQEVKAFLNSSPVDEKSQIAKDIDLTSEEMIYDKDIVFQIQTEFTKQGAASRKSAETSIGVNAFVGIKDLKLDAIIKGDESGFERFKVMLTGKRKAAVRFTGDVSGSMGLGNLELGRFLYKNDNETDLKLVKLKGIDRNENKIPIASVTWQIGTAPIASAGDFKSVPLGLTAIFFITAEGKADVALSLSITETEDGAFGIDYDPNQQKQNGGEITESEENFELDFKGSLTGKAAAGLDVGAIVGGLMIATVTGEAGINLEASGNVNVAWDKRTVRGKETNVYQDLSGDACYKLAATPYFKADFLAEGSYETDSWFGTTYEQGVSITIPLAKIEGKKLDLEPCAPVKFVDEELEQAVRDKINKQAGELARKDVEKITSLDAANRYIRNLKGIEYLKGLKVLDLSHNEVNEVDPDLFENMENITDLSLEDNRLSQLDSKLFTIGKLESLYAADNQIAAINSSWFGKINSLFGNSLQTLDLRNNKLTDIAPIVENRSLERLYLQNNKLTSIVPLAALYNLDQLFLKGNIDIDNVLPVSLYYNRLTAKDFSLLPQQSSFTGVWEGSMMCSREETAVRLTVHEQNKEQIEGVFDILSPSNALPAGSLLIKGKVNPYTHDVKLTGTKWIEGPEDAEMLDFKGSYQDSQQRISGEAASGNRNDCTSFSMQKLSSNTPFGNYLNDAWVSQGENSLYYRDYFDLYKKNAAGQTQKIYTTTGGGNVLGTIIPTEEYVYVSEEDFSGFAIFEGGPHDAGIYRVAQDGSKAELLHEGEIGLYTIHGDWIYYTDARVDEETWDLIYSLHRMKKDGSQKQLLADHVHYHFYMDQNILYYKDENRGSVFQLNTETLEKQEISALPDIDRFLFSDNRWIYYKSGNTFKRIDKTSHAEQTLIQDVSLEQINMSGDWIYYTKNNAIYKMKEDGTQNQKLIQLEDGYFYSLLLVNNAIYFVFTEDETYEMNLFRMNLDGSSVEKVHYIFNEFG